VYLRVPHLLELGDENDSPRGRIYLMRAVTDGRIPLDDTVRRHLDLCLDCRACESACPSGVQYGRLIEPFRIELEKNRPEPLARMAHADAAIRRDAVCTPNALGAGAGPADAMDPPGSRAGEDWTLAAAARTHAAAARDAAAPEAPLRAVSRTLPAEGPRRARVGLFTGCAADAFFPDTNLATARVLQKNGCEVWIPRDQVCCGALHYHAAQEGPAKQFAERNCEVFGRRWTTWTPSSSTPRVAGRCSRIMGT